jgi:hypothetical protein
MAIRKEAEGHAIDRSAAGSPLMKLVYRDRLRMAWELTWPMALIDLAVVIFLHGFLNVQGESADSIWAVVGFFGVSPWVVRRGLNLKYGRLRIQPRLGYQQSLKVMWLLGWRTLALSLAALVPVSLLFRVLHLDANLSGENPLINNVGLSVADAVSSLLFYPFLVTAMLRKRYRGFRLELVEEARPVPVPQTKKRSRK